MRALAFVLTILTSLLKTTASVIFFAALLSLPVYLLWNSLIPSLLHLRVITWFEAWQLLFLCGTLFKSVSFSRS